MPAPDQLGIHLTLLIGPAVPVPAPLALTEALDSVEVNHGDEGRSGFQISFHTGRGGRMAALDHALLLSPLLHPFSRVILIVTFTGRPRMLMDGIITHRQLAPGGERGASTLTVTGEDVSVMMDLEEKTVEHTGREEIVRVGAIIQNYAPYGLVPKITRPPASEPPLPIDQVPVQVGTDLGYLEEMARAHGYVFHVSPGLTPFSNIAYWGPPPRGGVAQRALTVDMGPATNLASINFQYSALSATRVVGNARVDPKNPRSPTQPIRTLASTRQPPLAHLPDLQAHLPHVRTALLGDTQGLPYPQAFARAQARTDASTDAVATAEGELDALRYGEILEPRRLVGLRGAGRSHDGLWYVKRVSHRLRRGEYKQSFSLRREGLGATVPAVIP